jgi:PE-PPE domain
MTVGWGDVAAAIRGVYNFKHAVLTVGGTWEPAPGTQYPSNTVNGLAQFVNDSLVYEVPVPYPASFGPVGGPFTSPSYQQSVDIAETWITDWLGAHPTQTFILGGYSQGGEVVSRIAIRLMGGDLAHYLPNFVGGYTFGNPCRGAGFHAPTIADPGGRGISAVNMTTLPTVNGQVVWADYVHSPANGDAGLDMYASVPTNQAGKDMTDVYTSATNAQVNNLGALTQDIVNTLVAVVEDLGGVPTVDGSLTGLLSNPLGLITLLQGALTGSQPIGVQAAIQAAINGIKFLAAPGGATAPHISYLSEIAGYSNLVADAVGWLNHIATLTPAQASTPAQV